MADSSFLRRRVDAGSWPLAVGDVLVIALLLTFGTVQHNGIAFVRSNPVYLAGTLAPFLVGWLLVSPLAGAYSPGAAESAKGAIPLGLRAWIGADVVGVALRASPLFHGGFATTFAIVTFVVVGGGLTAWRWLFFRLQ